MTSRRDYLYIRASGRHFGLSALALCSKLAAGWQFGSPRECSIGVVPRAGDAIARWVQTQVELPLGGRRRLAWPACDEACVGMARSVCNVMHDDIRWTAKDSSLRNEAVRRED
ncbi:uncharacterized protein RHO17_013528 [Thomomys bottae]